MLQRKGINTIIKLLCVYNEYVNEKGGTAGIKIVDEADQKKIVIEVVKSDSTTSLINEVNTILDELRADGTLTKLSKKIFGYDVTKIPE